MNTGMGVQDMSHALTMAGLEIEGVEPDGDDNVFEVNITPNRPDCLSVLGIARELKAITGKDITLADHKPADTGSTEFKVEISDPELCPRYAGRVVRGIKIGQSPEWMRRRLESCGIRCINNVVDITNYVLLEYGHPLHAFDLNTLEGGVIKVGVAGPGRTIRTLDAVDRKLPDEALLIWDGSRPVAVAGVMGGENTEVNDGTTDIFIESAYFKPTSVRRTSKALGLSTEASYRFERGTDILMLEHALNRAAALVAELAGGTVEAMVDAWPLRLEPSPIRARYSYINRRLGTSLSQDDILGILGRLELALKEDGDAVIVTPPLFRSDMTQEADVVEEVARIYGYANIPTVLPVAGIGYTGSGNRRRRLILSIKALFNSHGYHEAVNYSFMNVGHIDMLRLPAGDDRRNAVEVLNPIRVEDAHMRTTLIPTMISNLAHNISHGAADVRLIECAKVFIDAGAELPDESMKLGGVYYSASPRSIYPEKTEAFYLVKGAIESMFEMLRVDELGWSASKEPFLHPGKCAEITVGGTRAGFMGVLSPSVMEAFEIKTKHEAVVFELDLKTIISATPHKPDYRSIPRYPAVERDIALVVDKGVTADQVLASIKANAPEYMESSSIFDCYMGKGVPEGAKSLAFNIVYRSVDGTLTDDEVEKMHQSLVAALVKETGGEVRGS